MEFRMSCIGYPYSCLPWREGGVDHQAFVEAIRRVVWHACKEMHCRHFLCGVGDGMELYFAETVADITEARLEIITPTLPKTYSDWTKLYRLFPESILRRWEDLMERGNVRRVTTKGRDTDLPHRDRVYGSVVRRSALLLSCFGRPGELPDPQAREQVLEVERWVARAREIRNKTVYRLATRHADPVPHPYPVDPDIPLVRVRQLALTDGTQGEWRVLAKATVSVGGLMVIYGVRLVQSGCAFRVALPQQTGAGSVELNKQLLSLVHAVVKNEYDIAVDREREQRELRQLLVGRAGLSIGQR